MAAKTQSNINTKEMPVFLWRSGSEAHLRQQTRDDALEQSIQRRQEKGCWRLAAGHGVRLERWSVNGLPGDFTGFVQNSSRNETLSDLI